MNKTKKALVFKTLKKLPTGAHLMQLITNLVSWTGQEKKKKKKKTVLQCNRTGNVL